MRSGSKPRMMSLLRAVALGRSFDQSQFADRVEIARERLGCLLRVGARQARVGQVRLGSRTVEYSRLHDAAPMSIPALVRATLQAGDERAY
jgi:hypothetical protein